MDLTVQVRQRGALTLPAELRQKYGIQEGDTLSVGGLGWHLHPDFHGPDGSRSGTRDRTCPSRNEFGYRGVAANFVRTTRGIPCLRRVITRAGVNRAFLSMPMCSLPAARPHQSSAPA